MRWALSRPEAIHRRIVLTLTPKCSAAFAMLGRAGSCVVVCSLMSLTMSLRGDVERPACHMCHVSCRANVLVNVGMPI